MSSGTEHEDHFRLVYAANFERLLAYTLRRVEHPEDAADVVAEEVFWETADKVAAGHPPAGYAQGLGCD
ncbi:hypothetical protein [Micromonospora sp. CB01531]|uniref:hypothetical protein n=1 Tax=Micromonospora sp. CB01531 TaxID=1718947 RepID=UPI001F518A49|nr:hypothetical protein [Micromonospora sp. CB01531]